MTDPTVKLKIGSLESLAKESNANDQVSFNSFLVSITGMNYSQIYRILSGKSKIGVKFIASILAENPNKRFEDFFFIEK